jgi:HAD superfamily hydrolase (TIGR01509 family)
MRHPASGVVFDVDGTLIDNTYLHTVAWWRALREHRHYVPMYAIHRYIGMGSDQMLERLLGEPRSEVSEAYNRHFAGFRAEMTALPGAADLLRAVASGGLAVVLGTSAQPQDLPAMRAVIGADEVINHVVSSEDVERTKPAPDIFAVAVESAGLDLSRTLAVGDTGWDIEAARRLGIDCVALLSGGWSRAELGAAGAVAVYRHPAELLEKLERSPIAKLTA